LPELVLLSIVSPELRPELRIAIDKAERLLGRDLKKKKPGPKPVEG